MTLKTYFILENYILVILKFSSRHYKNFTLISRSRLESRNEKKYNFNLEISEISHSLGVLRNYTSNMNNTPIKKQKILKIC